MPVLHESKRRVALVVPDLVSQKDGGVATLAEFLLTVLVDSNRYYPEVISVPLSRRDDNSIRLTSPASWIQGVNTSHFTWKETHAIHVGARFVEFEFQRYRSRPELVTILNRYDLIQIIAGTPAWALLGKEVRPPVTLYVATMAASERGTVLRGNRGLRRIWSKAMTYLTDRSDHNALQYVDHLFVINDWMFEYVTRTNDSKNVTLAPPGVDTEIFYPAEEFPRNGVILAVGRFDDPRKNVGLLFRAYHALERLVPDLPTLVLAGSSMPNASDWRIAEKLGIADRVLRYEDVSQNELAGLYRQARLYVLSSNEEGLGIVLLEAMASAVPVIATRCGGPETIVVDGQNGFLVPVNDVQAMAEKMCKLLLDRDLNQKIGQNGRRFVVQNYAKKVVGERFLEVYDSVLTGA